MNVKFLEYQWSDADPVYCSPNYLQSLNEDYGWIGGYIDDELRLVIPYTVKKKLIFKIATFQLEPIVITNPVTEEQEKIFINTCVRMLAEIGVDFFSQPPTHVVFKVCPDNAIAAPFGSYIVNLDLSEVELWSAVHAKHRNVILNAKKKGVEIRLGANQDILAVYEMLVQTMGRSKMPFVERDVFMNMIKSLGDNVEVVVAYHDDKPMGCGVFPFSKYSAYYQYGGNIDTPVLGAMNLLHWESMKYFKNKGVKYYDFVGARISPTPGSKLEGIQRFKSRFGASMRIGHLWKIGFNYKYTLYSWLFKLKTKGKGDIIDQEVNRNKQIHLTFDYELFFKKSGTPEKCLLNPTERLLSSFKKYNIKGTFFIDILYYLRLLESDETLEDSKKIKKQLQKIVAQGSRIELHLHPHWLDARYVNGEWEFHDYSKYRLQSLDENEITELFIKGTKVLEDIARSVRSNYKITAFRAGGFCIEPFNKIKKGFIESKINIDSSVAPGMKGLSPTHRFEFLSVPELPYYMFNNNPTRIDKDGKFIELSITTYKKSIFRKIQLKLSTRLYPNLFKLSGDGNGLYFPIPIWRKIIKSTRMITLDGEMLPRELLLEVNKSVHDIVTIISHPKSLSEISFQCLERLVISGYNFVEIEEAVQILKNKHKE